MFERGFEFPHRADPLAARELVNFRHHHRDALDGREQPLPGFNVALEAWVPRVCQ